MKKYLLLGSCFLLTFYFSSAQQFGGNPSSMKWKQINTDTARVIFPEGMDSAAQRVASIVHYLAKNSPASLGNKLHKVNIVLQTQTVIPNGYVGLAPFRSEYFLTPLLNNFDLGSINWTESLALHEYRHVEQFNNFRSGLSNVIYYLFGEAGLLVAINAAVPGWFYEGDAVYNETISSSQGRGRLPLFLNEYKSLWIYSKDYKWMKLRNGSLKDYVPNHYPLGYLLVNYGREKYGLDFWAKVTKDASSFKGLFYPFQKAVKEHSGVDFKTFRNDAFDYYKKNISTVKSENIKDLTKLNEKYVTNYVFPYQLGGDSLVYLKTSYRHRPAFYIKTASGEERLRIRDISMDEQYSYRNGKIVYAAYEPDARWNWRDYSVIKVLDVQSGQQKTLTHRTKYFTPDISPDGNKIAAVEILPGGKSTLMVLDANDAKIIQQVHSREISVFTDPKFIDDNYIVTAVRLLDGKMALAIVDIAVGSAERLTVPGNGVLGYLSVHDNVVYFTSSIGGNDDLYALRLKDKKVFQLTQTQLGNYYVNASGEKLVWSGFTADGYQLREMNIKDAMWNEVGELAMTEPANPYPVAHANEFSDVILNKIPNRSFDLKRYRQGSHLFYVHSWRPYFEDPDFTYSVYSDNILNTFSSELFYHYNRDDKTHGFGANLLYGGFFPYINGGMEYTIDRPASVNNNLTTIDELETRIGLSLPLNFSSGKTFKSLNLGTNYVLSHRMFKGVYKDSIGTANLNYLHHYIAFRQQVQTATQHIFPKLGYTFSLNHRYVVSGNKGWQFMANAAVYLPGAHPAHSLVVTGSYQQGDTLHRRNLFSTGFSQARGYETNYLSQLTKMWKVGGNYHFPIVYPDWGFGNILYIQRVRGNAFYDFARFYSRNKTVSVDLKSVGGELYFDTKWWNEYPLTFGVRVSHLLDDDLLINGRTKGSNVFEVLIPIVIPR